MAKPKKPLVGGDAESKESSDLVLLEAKTVADQEHPDFVDGLVDDPADDSRSFTPNPEGPLPRPPLPDPFPGPLPDPFPIPQRPDLPFPLPFPQLKICGPVSGRYRLAQPVIVAAPGPLPFPGPVFPLRRVFMTVRVDVDRFYPQRRISVEASRLFPSQRAHVIATVTSDRCTGIYRRRIEANIDYRDGVAALIPGVRLIFEANRGARPFGYGSHRLTLIEANGTTRVHNLEFVSQYFDEVEFEVDSVANATPVVTSYDTASHPNRPATLPAEVIDLQTTFRRAGFDVKMSPNASVIPTSGAGANGTWSDAEMHNAMVTFWSRFSNAPQWAMWVLFAARHDIGRGLGGIMFDDIGPNHRQGTAIFTDSFIVDAPNGDPNPAAWRNRNVYWTAVHEMGHAFNLAHSWQKSLGNPWIPLANEPEARSFMNYPTRVAGQQQAFFSNFEFRFSDNELVFMRHAPRRFVQMGNENWFENHGFEKTEEGSESLRLHLRANRDSDTFAFLEPVTLELKLENVSGMDRVVDEDAIADGHHATVLVQRKGGKVAKWRPFATHCEAPRTRTLGAGDSMYASHFIAAASEGWLIDEPGFYMIQAAAAVNGETIVSNPLRVFIGTPASEEEEKLAPDYFTEAVARVLAFKGAPDLVQANDVLREVIQRTPENPAAIHAAVALSDPLKRDFKTLQMDGDRSAMRITTQAQKLDEVAEWQIPALVDKADRAARTMGHIAYRDTVEELTSVLAEAGDKQTAMAAQQTLVDTMKQRGVRETVVADSQEKLDRMSA